MRVAPNAEPSVNGQSPISGELVLPTITAPAAFSFAATAPSADFGSNSPGQPNAVGSPARSMSSLTAIGTPSSGSRSPAATLRSAASASARAASGRTMRNALSVSREASIRSMVASRSSTEPTSPDAISSACS